MKFRALDKENQYLEMMIKPDISGNGEHQNVFIDISDKEIHGIIKFSFKIYFPKNISNGEGEVFNSKGPHCFVALYGIGGADVITYHFQPETGEQGIVNVLHIPGQTDSKGKYTESDIFIGTGFSQDRWITVDTVLDTSNKTYYYTVTDGIVSMGGRETAQYNWKNHTEEWNWVGLPKKFRTYILRNFDNVLYYLKDIEIESFSKMEAGEAELASISLPRTIDVKYRLPVKGRLFEYPLKWESKNLDILYVKGESIFVDSVKLPAKVTLTAKTFIDGEEVTKDFSVMVEENITELQWYTDKNAVDGFIPAISGFQKNKTAEVYPVEKVKNYLEVNFGKQISLQDILEIYPYSKSKLYKDFYEEYNMSVFDMLTDIRLMHAKFALEYHPKYKVGYIASTCGFGSVSYFCKIYKRKYGISPKKTQTGG